VTTYKNAELRSLAEKPTIKELKIQPPPSELGRIGTLATYNQTSEIRALQSKDT